MKQIYFQPEVTVATIVLQSNLLTGSPTTPSGNSMDMNNTITNDQW